MTWAQIKAEQRRRKVRRLVREILALVAAAVLALGFTAALLRPFGWPLW